MTTRISRSAEFYFQYRTTVKDIQEFIEEVGAPPEARIDFYITTGDRPWESEEKRIEVSW